MGIWARTRQRYDALVERYGKIAVITYLTIFATVLLGFWAAVSAGADLASGFQKLGFDTSGASSQSGTLVVAYAFTKLTQPLRIGATLVLTPLVARAMGRAPASPERDA